MTPHATTLAVTAHHEAGHAVAAFLRRVPFKLVTIVPDGDASGHVLFPLRSVRSMDQTYARGVVALAGEAAQRRYAPRSVRRYHGACDRESVVNYALSNSSSSKVAQALVNLWQVQADELIEARWNAVQGVARALLEEHTLSADDVRRIVTPARVLTAQAELGIGGSTIQQFDV